jgi:hypothetical protein
MRVKPDSLPGCLVEGDRGGDMRVFEENRIISAIGVNRACPGIADEFALDRNADIF